MNGSDSQAEIEILSEAECLALLGRHGLGRVAIIVDGKPQIFPVNYAADGRTIAFRTAPGSRLAGGSRSHVAFEVDGFDEPAGVAWSVMVQGVAHDVTTAVDSASEAARRLAVVPMAPGERSHRIAIQASQLSGRRFRLAAEG